MKKTFFSICLFLFCATSVFAQNNQAQEFMTAIYSKKLDNVKDLIENKGYNVNTSLGNGLPIHTAISTGNHEIVKYLVEKGADLKALEKNYGGVPALTMAMLLSADPSKNMLPIAETLIGAGADVNDANNAKKQTALHVACATGKVELVNLLIKNKADLNLKNADGQTPLKFAKKMGCSACATAIKTASDAQKLKK